MYVHARVHIPEYKCVLMELKKNGTYTIRTEPNMNVHTCTVYSKAGNFCEVYNLRFL